MKRINLFWIVWIFVILEFEDIVCVSYPGVYRNELPVIIPDASPIENVFVTERYGINYECIETCYPMLNICDDKCTVTPHLPECSHCQQLHPAEPTPIIIETPPYNPRPPSFQHQLRPIVPYPSRLAHPPLIAEAIAPDTHRTSFPQHHRPIIPTPILPDIPLAPKVESELPPHTVLPSIRQPPTFESVQPKQPLEHPELEILETELITLPTVSDVSRPSVFNHVPFELPTDTISPEVILPDELEAYLPTQPIFPENPSSVEFEKNLEPQLLLPEILQPPQLEMVSPQILLPEFNQFQFFEPTFLPQSVLPHIPLLSQYKEFPQYHMTNVLEPEIYDYPSISSNELPQVPEVINPYHLQIPYLASHERIIVEPTYEQTYAESTSNPVLTIYVPEVQATYESAETNNFQQPTLTEYQNICNDYCIIKWNISECAACSESADCLELCSNCLANPSEPNCELCYPILLGLCREYCIFEENEYDSAACYAEPIIDLPMILTEELVNIPTMEYVIPQEICPEYCVLTPMSPECDGCVVGVEVVEKMCVDICEGYCLENPNDTQCAQCVTSVETNVVPGIEIIDSAAEELLSLEVINYQCCYGDYCTPMPRNGICPVVCKELCTTACSNECFNPACPGCQEVVALNELRRTQFMIWLKSKLSDMKSRYMAMIEACIQRTELMYERELQAIEVEADASFLQV